MGYALIDWKGKVLCTSKAPITKVPRGRRISYRSDDSIDSYKDVGHLLHCEIGQSKGKAIQYYSQKTEDGWVYNYSIEVVGDIPKDVEKIIEILEHQVSATDIDPRLGLPNEMI